MFTADVLIDSDAKFDLMDKPFNLKVKLLHIEFNVDNPPEGEYIRKCFRKSDVVVCVSEHKRWTLREFAVSSNVVTIPFGIPLLKPGNPVPGIVGVIHLCMNEQQERVWNHIHAHFPNAECTGSRNPKPCLDPQDYATFEKRFSRIDVFVNPVVGNACGMTIAEAMMRGIPVITGMNTDLPKELISGWNCVITQGHTYHCLDDIVGWCTRLCGDRELRHRMGAAARETAQRIYGMDKFRARWSKVLRGDL